ncbi:hypothetical protein HBI56_192010 [Parastagonospora nodorum]|uniref:Uncharacterized protein n=1 Tax=Phaeosphaeria nodorum (strain SN15 / ATCC MYA-4574 / FGSC 10173) TaxID=321614 RepID=A0A7U2IA92_PHANO|nr:hypothetical protein HBH56_178330 [Parastagonospora nodorum]QRD06147.1 hypothetical protein JI435_445330 [Parastagonospora nodorum SN15]KAH3931885.1 hypothetical protein HBH54_091490 [Parastagonospora nodorum]KAH3939601.1 hypothetical protein HBH53_232950 [Parastagonospora nodorum]KAH3957454.1 hypothetical protein HBH51_224910 [Parastagonospora nodorum]
MRHRTICVSRPPPYPPCPRLGVRFAVARVLQTWLFEAVPRHGRVRRSCVRRAIMLGMPTNRKRTRPTSPKVQATLSQLQ